MGRNIKLGECKEIGRRIWKRVWKGEKENKKTGKLQRKKWILERNVP